MNTKLLVGLIALFCVVGLVGSAVADSDIQYPDGSTSRALDIGNGIAFIFHDVPGDLDYFIQVVDFYAFLLRVPLAVGNGQVFGYAFWLDFEGQTSNGFFQYGVYSCDGPQGGCNFGNRRGTLFL